MAKRHKDVEYAVSMNGRNEVVFADFDHAASRAVVLAISGAKVVIDTLVYSEAGARFVGGDDAVAEYREDPDASVFNRLVVKVDVQGRIA